MKTSTPNDRWIRSLLAILFSCAPSGFAELKWEVVRKVPNFEAGSDRALVTFVGRNDGAHPLRIAGVKSTCDCAIASVDKTEVPPSGTCNVEVMIRRSARDPQPNSTVHLTSSDGAKHVLFIARADIPQVRATPALVWWRLGAAEEREILIEADPGMVAIKNVVAHVEGDHLELRGERVDAHRWKFFAKPRNPTAAHSFPIAFEISRAGSEPSVKLTAFGKFVSPD